MLTEINMPAIPITQLFLLFLFYSFVGWCCEEVYVSSLQKKFVYRGMLYGPICPIYGFGALAILYLLYPWRQTYGRLFFASLIITSILEYITSWVLEKLFHAKWWDYSTKFCNLNGRVCLLNSVLFGILGVLFEHFLHPAAFKLISLPVLLPYEKYIAIILAVILAVDIAFTIHKLIDFRKTLDKLKAKEEELRTKILEAFSERPKSTHELMEMIKEKSKDFSEKVKEKSQEAKESYRQKAKETQDAFEAYRKKIESMLNKFPSMKSPSHNGALEHFREQMKERIARKKKDKNNKD